MRVIISSFFTILMLAVSLSASPTSTRLQTRRIHTTCIIGCLYKNRSARGRHPRRRLISVSGRRRIIGDGVGTTASMFIHTLTAAAAPIVAAELRYRHERIGPCRSRIGSTGNCRVPSALLCAPPAVTGFKSASTPSSARHSR